MSFFVFFFFFILFKNTWHYKYIQNFPLLLMLARYDFSFVPQAGIESATPVFERSDISITSPVYKWRFLGSLRRRQISSLWTWGNKADGSLPSVTHLPNKARHGVEYRLIHRSEVHLAVVTRVTCLECNVPNPTRPTGLRTPVRLVGVRNLSKSKITFLCVSRRMFIRLSWVLTAPTAHVTLEVQVAFPWAALSLGAIYGGSHHKASTCACFHIDAKYQQGKRGD
jgi:hypothetical protein